MSPYRNVPDETEPSKDVREPCPDSDILLATIVFWLLSVGRVGFGFARRETSTEFSLALLVTLVVPWLFRDAIYWATRWFFSRRRLLRRSVRSRRQAAMWFARPGSRRDEAGP